MAGYNDFISRAQSGSDPLVPDPVSQQIIQELPTQSAILQRARITQLSARTQRQPVLSVLPTAYFVGTSTTDHQGGDLDAGLKQTTKQQWANVNLVVEEIACIVPIPEAYLDDAMVPIWDEVRPRMTEAIGGLVDGACLFGVNKPSTWGTDVYSGSVAVGNVVDADEGDDFGVAVAELNDAISSQGFNVNGFVGRPGLGWKLVGIRSAQGVPIYQPDLQNGGTGSLYGYPLNEVKNGSFVTADAELLVGDWSKAIVGMRQDISFKMFTEGVISDDSGAVVLNLMQQDSVAMRVTMRLAFATANPVTALQSGAGSRFPFGVIAPAGSGSGDSSSSSSSAA